MANEPHIANTLINGDDIQEKEHVCCKKIAKLCWRCLLCPFSRYSEGLTNTGANFEDNPAGSTDGKVEQKCQRDTNGGTTNTGAIFEDNPAGLTDVIVEQKCQRDTNRYSTNTGADINEGTDNTEGQSKTHYKRIKTPVVFVLLKDDRLKECIEKILKEMDLIPKYFHSDNELTFDENENYKFDDESTTVIVVRHGSIRIDSDIGGCCKHISDSDIKRTVVVIINEYGNNKKGVHGEVIKPNSYVIDNIQDLKNVVVINYKCCMKKAKCNRCKNALDELEQHARSQNYI